MGIYKYPNKSCAVKSNFLYNASSKNFPIKQNYYLQTMKLGQEENSYDLGDKLITNKYVLSSRMKNSFRNAKNQMAYSDKNLKKRQKEFAIFYKR